MDEMKIEDGKIMRLCKRCGWRFQFGPHRYDGRTLPSGEIVCKNCDPDR